MKLELKRDAILLLPEDDQDKAFIEDTLACKENGELAFKRVCDVSLDYAKKRKLCLNRKEKWLKSANTMTG